MPVWKFNEQCHIIINEHRVTQYKIGQYNEQQEGHNVLVSFEDEHILTLWI